jgi:hypothetical protein
MNYIDCDNISININANIITSVSGDTVNCKVIQGNGVKKQVTLQSQDFDKLRVFGPFEVYYINSPTNSITVSADQNIIDSDLIDIYNDNKVLSIRTKSRAAYTSRNNFTVIIRSPNVSNIEFYGNGKIYLKNINQDNIHVLLNKSGDIVMDGYIKNATLVNAANGRIKAENLKSDNLTLQLNGNGRIYAKASKFLDAEVNGKGKIIIYGRPQEKKINVNSNGQIKYR